MEEVEEVVEDEVGWVNEAGDNNRSMTWTKSVSPCVGASY